MSSVKNGLAHFISVFKSVSPKRQYAEVVIGLTVFTVVHVVLACAIHTEYWSYVARSSDVCGGNHGTCIETVQGTYEGCSSTNLAGGRSLKFDVGGQQISVRANNHYITDYLLMDGQRVALTRVDGKYVGLQTSSGQFVFFVDGLRATFSLLISILTAVLFYLTIKGHIACRLKTARSCNYGELQGLTDSTLAGMFRALFLATLVMFLLYL